MLDKKHTEEEFISDFKIENGVLKEFNGNPANVISPLAFPRLAKVFLDIVKPLKV